MGKEESRDSSPCRQCIELFSPFRGIKTIIRDGHFVVLSLLHWDCGGP